MRTIIDPGGQPSLLKKFGWFFGLWLAGVLTIGGIAMVLRTVLHAVQ